MFYGVFDVRDGIWGSEGIWAEKDPTHEEWGGNKRVGYLSEFLSLLYSKTVSKF